VKKSELGHGELCVQNNLLSFYATGLRFTKYSVSATQAAALWQDSPLVQKGSGIEDGMV
jgi:hypothetical protein